MSDAKRKRRQLAERIFKAIPPGADITDDEIDAMVTMFFDSKGTHQQRKQREQSNPGDTNPLIKQIASNAGSKISPPSGQVQDVEFRLSSGHYEAWQLWEAFELLKENVRAQVYMEVSKQWLALLNESLTPLSGLRLQYETKITEIVTTVRNKRGKLWTEGDNGNRTYPFSREDATSLAAMFSNMHIILKGIGMPEALGEYTPLKPFYDGIVNLITPKVNGGDDGQTLRRAVADYKPPTESFIQYTANIKLPGSPREEIIDRLCMRAKPYREQKPKLSFPKIHTQLIKDTENDPAAKEEFDYLADWDVDSFERAYRRRNKGE